MKRPQGRTLSEFGELSPAEQALLTACADGTVAKIGELCLASDTKENTVRAGFVAFLAMGGDETAPVHHRGVRLQGARIVGELDLSRAVLPSAIELKRCRLESANFDGAKIEGPLSLNSSEIGGQLTLRGAEVRGDMMLSASFTAGDTVSMQRVRIEGKLDCSSAQLKGTDDALNLNGAVVKGDVLARELKATGALWMRDVQIDGNLDCSGAELDGVGGDALVLEGCVVRGNVTLGSDSKRFKAGGTVSMQGAQVGGDLVCTGARLDGKGCDALVLNSTLVKGNVWVNDGFQACGPVLMLDVQVGGNLKCSGAQLNKGRGRHALSLDRAVIKGSAFFTDSFTARGKVKMLGAQVGGNLNFRGACSIGALSMEGAQIAGHWKLCELRVPLKNVRLSGCHVGRLVDDRTSWGENIHLSGFVYAQLAGGSPVKARDRIDWLRKQEPRAWGSKQDNGGFKPQPWLQLQKVLREMGHLDDARQVAIALEDHRRAIGLVGQTPDTWNAWLRRAYGGTSVFLHWAFKILIGYGYRPLRLVGWMVLVWVVSAAVFWCAALQGAMGPSNPLVFNDPELRNACATNWYLCEKLPEEYTGFSPLAYSLDVLLPLVNLEQEKDWAPLIPTPKPSWWQEWLANWSFKHVARLVVWAEILFGWIASLLLVAVFSGLTKRRDE